MAKGTEQTWLEANEFAVELLLPTRYVREPLRLNDPSLKAIGRVASQFETSLTATTLRFVSSSDLPCVAVWSEANALGGIGAAMRFHSTCPKRFFHATARLRTNCLRGIVREMTSRRFLRKLGWIGEMRTESCECLSIPLACRITTRF